MSTIFEKVNPSHPDKLCDRVAGALVDMAYEVDENPQIAVEVMIGHGWCHIIAETSVPLYKWRVRQAVHRIAGKIRVDYREYLQDKRLARNQRDRIRCGDNGIFRGVPITTEQKKLSGLVRELYSVYPYDGKFIVDADEMTVCQSKVPTRALRMMFPYAIVNPLGDWTGGPDVDTGATNRKLGSDMGDSVTGGGLHGKDLSKADVSINIYAWLKAQTTGHPIELSCSIGDETVDGKPYEEIVEIARDFIKDRGGFEKFAEWGLI